MEKKNEVDNKKEPLIVLDPFCYAGSSFYRATDVTHDGGDAIPLDLAIKNHSSRYAEWVSTAISQLFNDQILT